MSNNEKKEIIKKRLANGDTRSWNEIAADLELEIWTRLHKGDAYMEQQRPKKNSKS